MALCWKLTSGAKRKVEQSSRVASSDFFLLPQSHPYPSAVLLTQRRLPISFFTFIFCKKLKKNICFIKKISKLVKTVQNYGTVTNISTKIKIFKQISNFERWSNKLQNVAKTKLLESIRLINTHLFTTKKVCVWKKFNGPVLKTDFGSEAQSWTKFQRWESGFFLLPQFPPQHKRRAPYPKKIGPIFFSLSADRPCQNRKYLFYAKKCQILSK